VLNVTTGQSTLTNADGEYSFSGLTTNHFAVTKSDYEPAEFDATPDGYTSTPLQRIVRIAIGATQLAVLLATNDMDYIAGSATHCQPCRLIRITSTTSGRMQVRVTSSDASAVLNVWVNGQAFPGSAELHETVADLPIAAGEVVLYVGKIGSTATHADNGVRLPFTISTTISVVEPALSVTRTAFPDYLPSASLREVDRLDTLQPSPTPRN
jgi:hypothetical protein